MKEIPKYEKYIEITIIFIYVLKYYIWQLTCDYVNIVTKQLTASGI